MNTNENNGNNAGRGTASAVDPKAAAEAAKAEEAKKLKAAQEVQPGSESDMREERMQVTKDSVDEALGREVTLANPIRKGEVLIATECEGNLAAFKKALKDGLVIKPDGLEAVSFHCAGFAKRDEGIVAKQFNVTLKVNGKWQPLSRYIASAKGGHFAMGASQSLKGAKTLAGMLKAVWINGLDLKKKGK